MILALIKSKLLLQSSDISISQSFSRFLTTHTRLQRNFEKKRCKGWENSPKSNQKVVSVELILSNTGSNEARNIIETIFRELVLKFLSTLDQG